MVGLSSHRFILHDFNNQPHCKQNFFLPLSISTMLSFSRSPFPVRSFFRSFASLPKRSPLFSKLEPSDVQVFQHIVGSTGVLTSATDIEPFCMDWMKKYKGAGSVVLRPKTTEQVSAILKHCNDRTLAVVPQGGNTGLVGGSVPVYDEVVLSLSLMNNIDNFDESAGVVTCEAGVVLEQLNKYLNDVNHTVPLDLGAKGSCQIGGNVSTNAGGIRFLRYGSLHGSVCGLEVVLANGEILDLMSTIRKDNTGYDLKQLFIGAEGTLGVVTKVALVAPPKPLAQNVAFFALKSFDDVLKLLRTARQSLGEVLSAFETLDGASMNLVEKYNGGKSPVCEAPFYVLIETSGSDGDHDAAKIDNLLSAAFGDADGGRSDAPLVLDGAMASSETQSAAMWALREGLAEALIRRGAVYKYDLSLPVPQFYSAVEAMRERFRDYPECLVCGYGHVGDGNLHLNISVPEYNDKYVNVIEPFIYEFVAERRGSVSAEHGLGVMKPNYIHFSKPPQAVALMRSLKTAFDARGILNPYKVLPAE